MAGSSERPYDMTNTKPFQPKKSDPEQVEAQNHGKGKPSKAPKTMSDSLKGFGVDWQSSPAEKGDVTKAPLAGHRPTGGNVNNGHGRWK